MPIPVAALAAKATFGALQTPKGRAILATAVLLVVSLGLGGLLLVAAVAGSTASFGASGNEAVYQQKCVDFVPIGDGVAGTTYSDFTAEQKANATTIIAVAKSIAVGPAGAPDFDPDKLDDAAANQALDQTEALRKRAATIALATSMQESMLRNIDYGDRDSVGLFQQRTLTGWGTIEQIMDPQYSASAFFYGVRTNRVPGLVDVKGWHELPLTQAAQAVQVSGFPDAYQKWTSTAEEAVTALWYFTQPMPIHPALERATDSEEGGDTDDLVTFVRSAVCNASSNSDWIPTSDGIGAWGGYSNGQIPADVLQGLSWAPHQLLRPDAADAFEALNVEFKAEFGTDVYVTDSFRSYADQVRVKAAKGWLAATPGTSNHGWALALDLGSQINVFTSAQHKWMQANAYRFGWFNPEWAKATGSKPEAWHWEYYGPQDPTVGDPDDPIRQGA